ncbi:MAG: HAMP domain-containing histidine kinase [Tannerellaceae bacterium]|jgi:two-component sensor histidine kinase|nr:HAMP domain-containing histidine kinase [Tannerellaceae bacterium]
MANLYDARRRLKYAFVCVAVLIAVGSMTVTHVLVEDLAQEERKKVELLSEALCIVADGGGHSDISLALRVIVENTSIPIILCDEGGNIISSNNIYVPAVEDQKDVEHRRLQKLRHKNPPVIVNFEDGSRQYLYYDDSLILKRLNLYPYIHLGVVSVFIFITFLALVGTKRAEQNKVWVGLSKETAHQLGTPISSLGAWVEHLRDKNVYPDLLDEMDKDVIRLGIIAERFSKIGSSPVLRPIDVRQAVLTVINYMSARISSKIKIHTILPETPAQALLNDSLFAWVIENLIKNAVDAMEGQGEITLRVEDERRFIYIDISDGGKGIPRSKFKTVFNPGYTTKIRGWGLGLSLVKRIVESYHRGRVFVKNSEIGKGTTFRVKLRKQ